MLLFNLLSTTFLWINIDEKLISLFESAPFIFHVSPDVIIISNAWKTMNHWLASSCFHNLSTHPYRSILSIFFNVHLTFDALTTLIFSRLKEKNFGLILFRTIDKAGLPNLRLQIRFFLIKQQRFHRFHNFFFIKLTNWALIDRNNTTSMLYLSMIDRKAAFLVDNFMKFSLIEWDSHLHT